MATLVAGGGEAIFVAGEGGTGAARVVLLRARGCVWVRNRSCEGGPGLRGCICKVGAVLLDAVGALLVVMVCTGV